MDLALSPADVAFRDEVRRFLDDKFTPDMRDAAARQTGVFVEGELYRHWHKTLYEQGWIAPAWPKRFGGAEFTPVQRYLFESELADAGAPILPPLALQMCGPVLMGYGTPAQQAHFLPRILSGEDFWCQGYSEPQSGSDLASLQCRAVRDGDDYVITGSKIWTTHAQYANWMFLLARTSTEGKPQSGITFLLMPMDTPGVTVQPIITISGEHEVNQVFLDGARTSVNNRVGEENQGWAVAKYLLEFERSVVSSPRIKGLMNKIRKIAKAERADDGGALWADENFRRRAAEIEIEVAAVEYTEKRLISALSVGGRAGDATASILKLKGTETMQHATELALEAIAHYAAPNQRGAIGEGANAAVIGPDHALAPTARYLNTRAATIYGGSSEIQRNILARAALGL